MPQQATGRASFHRCNPVYHTAAEASSLGGIFYELPSSIGQKGNQMELVRNERLNGIELHTNAVEYTNNKDTLFNLGWYYSKRKGLFYHTYDEALIASTKRAIPSLDKKPKAKAKSSQAGAEKAAAPKAKAKASSTKAEKPKTKKAEPKKAKPSKKEVKVADAVKPVTFDISKAGFKADPSIGVDDLKVWKAAVLHSVEEVIDGAIAALVQ